MECALKINNYLPFLSFKIVNNSFSMSFPYIIVPILHTPRIFSDAKHFGIPSAVLQKQITSYLIQQSDALRLESQGPGFESGSEALSTQRFYTILTSLC
jgi:hypothetical protein